MANLTGGANFIKYLLFLINFFFVLTGIIILSIGATVQGVYHGYAHFLDDQFFSVPALLIAIGSLVFIIAFFGCCGAIRENYCMVITFSVLLGCIFILEFAAGISGYVLRNETKDLLRVTLNSTLHEYDDPNYKYMTILWDEVQRDFQCCGVDDANDWIAVFNKVPISCCPAEPGIMDNFTCNATSPNLFKTGCLTAFGDFIKSHAVSLGAAGLVIALFQVIGIFATCFVARKIKQSPTSVTHNQF